MSADEELDERTAQLRDRLLAAQLALREAHERSVVFIVTGLPTAGRTETVRKLLEWMDPKFVTVRAFGVQTVLEKQRPAMWRFWQNLPPRGRVALFFDGWYPDLLHAVSKKKRKALEAAQRRILRMEEMLVHNDVQVVKVHLHVSAKTQRKRLKQLESSVLTRWRVTAEDRRYARHYKRTCAMYERCIQATDTQLARWHRVDGTNERKREYTVARILVDALTSRWPAKKPRAAANPARDKKPAHVPMSGQSIAVDEDQYEIEVKLLQGRLARLARKHAFERHSLVLAFEGMDAAGKGGTIRRLSAALDPRQYEIVPISAPTPEELDYPYLWRFWRKVPQCGHITVFDRSWYGRVLVERVRKLTPEERWQRAYEEIVEFESELQEHGAVVCKFWLAVSPEEQLKRFQERESDTLKRYKVDPEDWKNRELFGEYQRAAAEMIARTNAPHIPWMVVNADDKRAARIQVLRAVCENLEQALKR